MIASLRGILLEKNVDSVVIEAGGVGYHVLVTRQALQNLGDTGAECHLLTHFHVREDAQQLFGFNNADEKKAFLLLTGVKGVGPRLALGILSALSPSGLFEAVRASDLAGLNALPGVGKKLADRLVVELKDKAQEMALAAGTSSDPIGLVDEGSDSEQAVTALQNLGFSAQQAKLAVSQAHKQLGSGDNSLEDIVKTALKLV